LFQQHFFSWQLLSADFPANASVIWFRTPSPIRCGVAIIAGMLGIVGIAGASASTAQILFFLFLVRFVVSLLSA
jgi:uncharacterized membrane protein YtjA (UPF0391 family)